VSFNPSIRFAADPARLASVRDFAVEAAAALGSRVDPDIVAVVVGELAANAVVHQRHEAEMQITVTPLGGLQISVCDPDPAMPRMAEGEPWDVTGHRGLQLVAALADSWGVDPLGEGKRVWAVLVPEPAQVVDAD
jgi:anti-sigma regulatory factor (Ser/Thr protein kinase)